jgi:hypothetical protein
MPGAPANNSVDLIAIYLEARNRLWPYALPQMPTVTKPKQDDQLPIDDEIAAILKRRKITSANLKGAGSLLDEGFPPFLKIVTGDVFAPYFEMRAVWIPLAYAFAKAEDIMQPKRFERSGYNKWLWCKLYVASVMKPLRRS